MAAELLVVALALSCFDFLISNILTSIIPFYNLMILLLFINIYGILGYTTHYDLQLQ